MNSIACFFDPDVGHHAPFNMSCGLVDHSCPRAHRRCSGVSLLPYARDKHIPPRLSPIAHLFSIV
jgi:hypothetical protein